MSLLTHILDLIFPPSEHALRVRALTPERVGRLVHITHSRDVVTLFPYRHPDIEALLWQLKYYGDTKAAKLIAGVLEERYIKEIKTPHSIVPIPLSSTRMRERGYNQVQCVCRHLSLPTYLTLSPHTLTRVRHTTPQTTLSRLERLTNLRNAFAVQNPDEICNKKIILIDDVTTTGATLREARETLLRAGAKSVQAVAFARS